MTEKEIETIELIPTLLSYPFSHNEQLLSYSRTMSSVLLTALSILSLNPPPPTHTHTQGTGATMLRNVPANAMFFPGTYDCTHN